MMPRTFSGKSSPAAMITVAAPMETPVRKISGFFPKLSVFVRFDVAYSIQERQSNRSFTPKEMVQPSLSPWARWSTTNVFWFSLLASLCPPQKSRSGLPL